MLKTVEYDAYGNITSQSGTGELGRYAWTGRELDVETGLQYNRARSYDSSIGRWISQDPLGFAAGDSNLYRYVNNRPDDKVDPSGLYSLHTSLSLYWGIYWFLDKGFQIGGKDESKSLYKNSFAFEGGTATVKVYTNAGLAKNLTIDTRRNLIALELKVKPGPKNKNPVAKVHWLQFVHSYHEDPKGKLITFDPKARVTTKNAPLRFFIDGANRYQHHKKGFYHLDTISENKKYPYADYTDANGRGSVYLRSPVKLTFFDRPENQRLDKAIVGKSTTAVDSFLVTESGKVLYRVHWERVRDQVKNTETYANIWGQPTDRLPPYGFGPELLAGYGDIKNKPPYLFDPVQYRNPFSQKDRRGWFLEWLSEHFAQPIWPG